MDKVHIQYYRGHLYNLTPCRTSGNLKNYGPASTLAESFETQYQSCDGYLDFYQKFIGTPLGGSEEHVRGTQDRGTVPKKFAQKYMSTTTTKHSYEHQELTHQKNVHLTHLQPATTCRPHCCFNVFQGPSPCSEALDGGPFLWPTKTERGVSSSSPCCCA